MILSRLVKLALVSFALPSLVRADPESLHTTSPPPPSLIPPPAPLIPDQRPMDLLPRQLRKPTLLEHAQHRKVIGRSLTLAGIGALVVAFGAGVPLLVASSRSFNYDMQVSGITLASIFGALGGSAITVGPILWQLGASEETRLRDGDFELLGSLRNRRIAGGILIGVGVLGEIAAMVGGGMLAAGISIDDEGGQATQATRPTSASGSSSPARRWPCSAAPSAARSSPPPAATRSCRWRWRRAACG